MAAKLAWLPGPLLLDAASDMADITAAFKTKKAHQARYHKNIDLVG